jgi:hypothetical protein
LGVDENIEQRLPIANPLNGGNLLVVSAPPRQPQGDILFTGKECLDLVYLMGGKTVKTLAIGLFSQPTTIIH